jgi:hypothetical protein
MLCMLGKGCGRAGAGLGKEWLLTSLMPPRQRLKPSRGCGLSVAVHAVHGQQRLDCHQDSGGYSAIVMGHTSMLHSMACLASYACLLVQVAEEQ